MEDSRHTHTRTHADTHIDLHMQNWQLVFWCRVAIFCRSQGYPGPLETSRAGTVWPTNVWVWGLHEQVTALSFLLITPMKAEPIKASNSFSSLSFYCEWEQFLLGTLGSDHQQKTIRLNALHFVFMVLLGPLNEVATVMFYSDRIQWLPLKKMMLPLSNEALEQGLHTLIKHWQNTDRNPPLDSSHSPKP